MELDMLIERVLMERDANLRVASVAALYDGKVALVRASKSDEWTLPGGHPDADEGESVEVAACRELDEETSLRVKPADLIFVGHIQRSKKKVDTIFTVELKTNQRLKAGTDAAEVKWADLNSLPKLAVGHNDAIKQALKTLKIPPAKRGLLVAFEGVDGSGKSTQVQHLVEWLLKHDFSFIQTKWNSSPLLGRAIKQAKKRQELFPALYHLLHAADMTHRYESLILPALTRNKIVVCDRWSFTGMVRDQLRGIKPEAHQAAYGRFRKPDVVFFCAIDPNLATARLLKVGRLSYYGTGMDLKLASSQEENMFEYEKRMAKLYVKVMPKSHKHLDMARKIKNIFYDVKREVQKAISKRFLSTDNTLEESAQELASVLLG